MKVINTKLDGVLIIEPRIFGDERGFSMRLSMHNVTKNLV